MTLLRVSIANFVSCAVYLNIFHVVVFRSVGERIDDFDNVLRLVLSPEPIQMISVTPSTPLNQVSGGILYVVYLEFAKRHHIFIK